MTRTLMTLLALGAALTAAPVAEAQIGRSGGPLDVQARQMDVFDEEGRILLRGEVDVIQGDTRLAADEIEIFYTPGGGGATSGGFGDIRNIVATGNVFYVTPLERARGNRGVYEAETDTVTLTGDVVLTRCENVITTTRFVTNLTTGNSSFDGQESGGRVRAVLFNEDEQSGSSRTNCGPASGNSQ
ncbi:MAG: OstA family protein [Maricaulis sp.]|nr:OstA family protein [Maricaulis sp.]